MKSHHDKMNEAFGAGYNDALQVLRDHAGCTDDYLHGLRAGIKDGIDDVLHNAGIVTDTS